MKFLLIATIILPMIAGQHELSKARSADSIFENNYSSSTRDACRQQFKTPEDRLKCAQYVTKSQQRELLEQSIIRANNAQSEKDQAIADELNDNDRTYIRRKTK